MLMNLFMENILNSAKSVVLFWGKSLYYGLIISLIIMQVGCVGMQTKSIEQNQKAKASLIYGKSSNTLVAHKTGALFY